VVEVEAAALVRLAVQRAAIFPAMAAMALHGLTVQLTLAVVVGVAMIRKEFPALAVLAEVAMAENPP